MLVNKFDKVLLGSGLVIEVDKVFTGRFGELLGLNGHMLCGKQLCDITPLEITGVVLTKKPEFCLPRYHVGDYVRFSRSARYRRHVDIYEFKRTKRVFKIAESITVESRTGNVKHYYKLDEIEGYFEQCELTRSGITTHMIYVKNKRNNDNCMLEKFLNKKVVLGIRNEAEFKEFELFLEQRALSHILNGKSYRKFLFEQRSYDALRNVRDLFLCYDINQQSVRVLGYQEMELSRIEIEDLNK